MFISPMVTARKANDWKCTALPSESPFGMPRSATRGWLNAPDESMRG